jgi:hypothetical protein
LLGFGLLSASISWLLLIYPALSRRRSLAYEITLLTEAGAHTGAPPAWLQGAAAEGVYAELTSRLVAVERDFVSFPIAYYFVERDKRFALASAMPTLLELAEQGRAERHALWWPPTKVAGRYLAPFLASLEDAERVGEDYRPEGRLVQLDLERELPAVADALTLARLRAAAIHADHELRRAERRAAGELRELQSGLDRLRQGEQETEEKLRAAGYLRRDDA